MHPPAATHARSAKAMCGIRRVRPSIRGRLYWPRLERGPGKTAAHTRGVAAPHLRTAPAVFEGGATTGPNEVIERSTPMGLLDQLGGMLGGNNQPAGGTGGGAGGGAGGGGDIQQLL